ncbi:AraC family transcriptional regulator [Ruegeria marina]|uniref:AraC-type DNA-binding protein n=1 Tax=Ruegeria marina TaxID=639004 RepID=A0A1G7FGP0_9RHOB|nr:AraC family transcriptional regulator [Ruegeria marina]SDE74705.1 AraC-type DNA-binding protein [Ruegeria marina]
MSEKAPYARDMISTPETDWGSTLRTVSPARIILALELMSETGIAHEAVLEGTGLAVAHLDVADLKTSSRQFDMVLCNMARLDPRPEIGVLMGQRVKASTYGMFGYALLCAPTLRDAFESGVRYQPLTGGPDKQRWYLSDSNVVWLPMGDTNLFELDFSHAEAMVMRDYHVTSTVSVIRDVMGPWCRPELVRLTGSPPQHAAQMANAMQCALEFASARNEILYSATLLDRAPQLASPITAAEVSQTCARLLDQMRWDTGTTRRVYHELTNRPGHFPDLEAVASDLCMTSRTLRRKLAAEGTSFRELLDEVRCALANDYLQSSDLPIDDIAQALDFNDTPSFRRAYRRWTGKTPSAARNQGFSSQSAT